MTHGNLTCLNICIGPAIGIKHSLVVSYFSHSDSELVRHSNNIWSMFWFVKWLSPPSNTLQQDYVDFIGNDDCWSKCSANCFVFTYEKYPYPRSAKKSIPRPITSSLYQCNTFDMYCICIRKLNKWYITLLFILIYFANFKSRLSPKLFINADLYIYTELILR